MTSTCVINQVEQTHLLISKIDVNRIIQTCDSLVINHNTTVVQLISLFSKISGYDSYCQQIVSLCNQILSDTVTSSNDVVNLCKKLKSLELPLDKPDTYLAVDHGEGTGSLTFIKQEIPVETISKACEATSLGQNNVSPSISKPPVATRKPILPIATIKSESSIVTNNLQLHPPSSQGELPLAISALKCELPMAADEYELPVATNKSEIPKVTSRSKFAFIKSTNPKSNTVTIYPKFVAASEPELPIVTNKPELPIVTNKPELTIVTNKPELSIATVSNQNNMKSSTIFPQILKNATASETIDTINNILQNNANLLQSNSVPKSKHLVPKSKHLVPKSKHLVPKSKHKVVRKRRRKPKPRQKVVCEICGKVLDRFSLKSHRLIHQGHKPVACPHCEYRCIDKCYLNAHLATHNKDVKHQCVKCGKCYGRRDTLNKHESTHIVTH